MDTPLPSVFSDDFSTLSHKKSHLAGAFSGSSNSIKTDIDGLRRISSLFEDEILLSPRTPMQSENDGVKRSSSRGLCIFFSFIYTVSGLFLFSLGIYILFDTQRTQMQRIIVLSINNVTPLVPVLYYITLGITSGGFIIFLCGVWTFAGTLKRNLPMIILSLTFITMLLLAQITLACISIVYQIGIYRNLKTELLSRLYNSYNMPHAIHFTSAMDYVQTKYSCCGITGDFDFQRSQWHRQHLGGVGLSVPRSCCVLSNKLDVNSFLNPDVKDLEKCNHPGGNNDFSELKYFRHMGGCLDAIVDWARIELLLVIGASIGICLLEGLGITLLLHYYRSSKKAAKDTKEMLTLGLTPSFTITQ
ncbi:tetraspanin-33 [Lepeophtheirus salmonis]|nr:CD151 antigen-like [Lepeophtheirus salmonis]